MDRTEELVEEIKTSVGFRVQNELEFLSANFYVFDVNYQDWKKYLSKFDQPKNLLNLWDQKNRKGFMSTLSEMTRLLLNFLSSATSLVSATRNSVPVWYQGTDFAQEYEMRKSLLAKDEECKFVEDLRNYSQHYQIPFARGRMLISSNKIVGQFVLSSNALLAWQGWAKGKMFLMKNKGDIDLEVLVDNYYSKILGFHRWIFNSIQDINSSELQAVSEKQNELSRLLKDIYETD